MCGFLPCARVSNSYWLQCFLFFFSPRCINENFGRCPVVCISLRLIYILPTDNSSSVHFADFHVSHVKNLFLGLQLPSLNTVTAENSELSCSDYPALCCVHLLFSSRSWFFEQSSELYKCFFYEHTLISSLFTSYFVCLLAANYLRTKLLFLLLDRLTNSSVDRGIKSKTIQNSCVGIFSMRGCIFDKYSQDLVILTCLQMKIYEWF